MPDKDLGELRRLSDQGRPGLGSLLLNTECQSWIGAQAPRISVHLQLQEAVTRIDDPSALHSVDGATVQMANR
jgi:hypothetical protein